MIRWLEASDCKTDTMKMTFHLPGLFEFYEFYKAFLPLYRNHREYFYDGCEIGSVYGAPSDCLWGGGRVGFGESNSVDVLNLMKEYGISSRLTFSNSLLREEHLSDKKCNRLCEMFESKNGSDNGIIIASDLLKDYISRNYPGFYFVSSTTKVLTSFEDFEKELSKEYQYVVPDFRLNKDLDRLGKLPDELKYKVEFLCNECCSTGCTDRKKCYENVSLKNLGECNEDHICRNAVKNGGYSFSKAMDNPSFIGIDDIRNIYEPMGFTNFKIEGRSLGSAVVFEMLLYYMVKPEYWLNVREEIYLDSMLDLF